MINKRRRCRLTTLLLNCSFPLRLSPIEIVVYILRDYAKCITQSWRGMDYYIRVGHQLTKIDCFSRDDTFETQQNDLTQPQPNFGPLLGIFCPQDIKRACLLKSPYSQIIISYLARKIFCFVFLLQLESNHSLPVPSGSNTSGLAQPIWISTTSNTVTSYGLRYSIYAFTRKI